MYVCVCIYIYIVRVCVCMCIYIYIYIHTRYTLYTCYIHTHMYNEHLNARFDRRFSDKICLDLFT